MGWNHQLDYLSDNGDWYENYDADSDHDDDDEGDDDVGWKLKKY